MGGVSPSMLSLSHTWWAQPRDTVTNTKLHSEKFSKRIGHMLSVLITHQKG